MGDTMVYKEWQQHNARDTHFNVNIIDRAGNEHHKWNTFSRLFEYFGN